MDNGLPINQKEKRAKVKVEVRPLLIPRVGIRRCVSRRKEKLELAKNKIVGLGGALA